MKIVREAEPQTHAQRIALGFFDGLGDPKALEALFADDIIWTIWGDLPFSGTHRGRQAVMEEFHGPAGALFAPDGTGQITITSIVGTGDTVVVEFQNESTTAIGRAYHNHYVEIFEIRDGRIAEVREYCDTAHLRSAAYEGRC